MAESRLPTYVLDASVVAKFVLAEEFSPDAEALLNLCGQRRIELAVPDWTYLEIAQVLARRVRRGSIGQAEARRGFDLVHEFDLKRHGHADLLISAFELGLAHQQAIYDCLYLALALRLGCPLITADRRFFEGTSRAFPGVRLLGSPIPGL